MLRSLFFCIALVFFARGLAVAETHAKSLPTLDAFLAPYDFWGPELSPSGRYVAGIRRVGDLQQAILVIDLDQPGSPVATIPVGDFQVNWIEWATDERLLVSATGFVDLASEEQISLPLLAEAEFPARLVRLLAVNRDGSSPAAMFADDRRMNRNFQLGRVASLLRQDPDHILMPANRQGDLDLFRVNIHTGAFERIANGTGNTYYWFIDRNGEPAFRYNINDRGTIVRIYAREEGRGGRIRWKRIRTVRLNRDRGARETATEFQPLSPGPTETTFYVAARPEAAPTTGIYLYDFEQDLYLEQIKAVDGIDVSSGVFDEATGAYLGAVYLDDRLEYALEDPFLQSHLEGLSVYFGETANVSPVSASRDGRRWLVHAQGPTEPGGYHVYDVDEARAEGLAYGKFGYAGLQFSDSKVIHYQARDGLSLRGYLTRPHGISESAQPPLVMLPHGGPAVRDYFTFDPMVQYLAALGYQVFQPNFRGSSGFGEDFIRRSHGQFGKAMQTDVEDGFRHLVGLGLVDADRACILGYSYGGYVSMAAATLSPELYQCAIAGAGISDLVEMLRWERREEGRNSEAYQYWVELIGDPRRDRDALNSVSPAKLAARVEVPMLLIHGKADLVVPIKQSELMYEALKASGKPVDRLWLDQSGHSYRGEGEREREYLAISSFLEEHLPVD